METTITDLALARRIPKLPAWARDLINHLDRQLAEARETIAKLNEGPADSNVRVDTHSVRPDRLLGRNIPVSFDLAAGTIVIKHDGDEALEVYCTGTGASYYPHVLPSTANTFRIRLGER